MTSTLTKLTAIVALLAAALVLLLQTTLSQSYGVASQPQTPARQLRVLQQDTDPRSEQEKNDRLSAQETAEAQHYPTGVAPMPLHMIQIGRPRTATTYQQHLVCASLFLKLEGSLTYEHPVLGTLDTQDLLQKMTCPRIAGKAIEYPPDVPVVIKTHHVDVVNEQLGLEAETTPMWVFKSISQKKKLSQSFPNMVYVQEVESLKERGHDVVLDYANIFGLTDSQVEDLIEYIEPWVVLRQCCGCEMSKGWRNLMLPDWSPLKERVDPTEEPHLCSKYDIDQVERSLIDSALYQRMREKGGRGLSCALRPSTRDRKLSGSYCSEYNEIVRTEGVGFGQGVKKTP